MYFLSVLIQADIPEAKTEVGWVNDL